MTVLTDHLIKTIKADGPISFARYMAECLANPKYGYYMTRDPFGKAGDFITSPEVTQMFGEMVGLWIVDCWQKMSYPPYFNLVELGPGRGTLMTDILSIMNSHPDTKEAVQIHLVEISPTLKEIQRKNLEKMNVTATWYDRFMDVPEGPTVIIANEFFDTLPHHQFIKMTDGWAEHSIAVDNNKLKSIMGPPTPAFSLLNKKIVTNAKEGDILEVCPPALYMMGDVANRLKSFGGAALIIDYGYTKPGAGDTIQAIKGHNYQSVLENPGETDITAHINFMALQEALAESEIDLHGPVTQCDFLKNLGIDYRAEQIIKANGPDVTSKVQRSLKKLIDKKEMGELFKVLGVSYGLYGEPPGFHNIL
ncbi:MAG: class I SAM-dependent methyltransferase [Sphingomonadales bacterium]